MYTFPSAEVIQTCMDATPDYMFPSRHPWLAVAEERLSDKECDLILAKTIPVESYRFPKCNAATRELESDKHPELKPIADVLYQANEEYWGFDLGGAWTAWMQTYREGDSYAPHLDGSCGQTRKLTAIALLTPPDHYVGGDLAMYIHPHTFPVPRIRGTIVVFPHWVIHEVMPVQAGIRQTINLGVWGPPFR